MLWGRHDPIIKYEWADKLGDYFADIEVSVADGELCGTAMMVVTTKVIAVDPSSRVALAC